MKFPMILQGVCWFLLAAVTVFSISVWAQDENRAPFVSNVHAEQRTGTKLVDITYDVTDPDGDLLTITISVSDDGGSTFAVPAGAFTGDVGSGIAPGPNKQIVWDAGADVPEVYSTNYRIKITASDGLAGGATIIGQDGVPMALIPAGEFQMGDSLDEMSDALPVHTVYLDAFFMDVYEVSNAEYAQFLNSYGRNTDDSGNELLDLDDDCLIEKSGNTYRAMSGYEEHPVIEVSWYGANTYAEYYGKRLPTEAEWEKAARGGLVGKRYPWGDSIDSTKANYDADGTRDWTTTADMLKYLEPVGSFAPNGYGLYDMAGNVEEWCADWYDEDYYPDSPRNNPKGPNSGSERVLRGGCWCFNESNLPCAGRGIEFPTLAFNFDGFRCAE